MQGELQRENPGVWLGPHNTTRTKGLHEVGDTQRFLDLGIPVV